MVSHFLLLFVSVTCRKIEYLLDGRNVKLLVGPQDQSKLNQAFSLFADDVLDSTAHLHGVVHRILDAKF